MDGHEWVVDETEELVVETEETERLEHPKVNSPVSAPSA